VPRPEELRLSGHPFRPLSRRSFSGLLLNGAAAWASRAAALGLNEADRGVGGTGANAVEPG